MASANNGYVTLDQETMTVDEKLRCCACRGYFNLRERLPRLLRCMHAICQSCFQRRLQESSEFKCHCDFLTRTTGTNVDQLEVDVWAVCIMEFLTPASVGGDLSMVDVPRLLSSVRAHVNAATIDVIRGGVAAMSVSSPAPGSSGQGPNQLYPALTSTMAAGNRADNQKMRELSRQVHVPVQNQPLRNADGLPSWGTKVNTAVVPVQPTSRGSLPPPGFSGTGASDSNTSQHEESKRRTASWALSHPGVPGSSVYPSTPSTFLGSGDSAAYFTPAVVKQEGRVHQNTDQSHDQASPMETSDLDGEERYRQADRSGVDILSSSKPPSYKIEREDPQGSDAAEYRRDDRALNTRNGRTSSVDDYDQRDMQSRRRQLAGDSGSSSRHQSKKRRSSSRDSRSGKDAHRITTNRQKMIKGRGETESDDEEDRQSAKSRPPRRRNAKPDGPSRRVPSVLRRRLEKEGSVGGKKQDKLGRPNVPDNGDSSSSSSSEAENGSTANVGTRQFPARRRDPSPAMSVRSRRGAGSSLPLVMNPSLDPFFKPVPKLTNEERDESCTVCLENLKDGSSYDDAYLDARAVVRLSCGHMFHHHCAVQVVANQAEKSFVKCSSCNQTHGTRVGDQPDGGRMTVELLKNEWQMVSASKKKDKTSSSWYPFGGKNSKPAAVDHDTLSLSGFPGTDTIRISYDFPGSGRQGPNHPNPGKYYNATAFPRIAYLPYNEQGYEVLCMLMIAFDRRLIFTVGTSSTTGASDTLVWAGIHHKTSNSGGEHGYPDSGYLDRVTEELKEVGITPKDIPHNPAVSLGIGF